MPLKLTTGFLKNRLCRVVLNGQTFKWLPFKVGVLHGPILGSFLFLIFIKDLSKRFSCITKLFYDDTWIFTAYIVNEPKETAEKLNNDFKLISSWAYQWEMSFNPGISKQRVSFLKKITKITYFSPLFNNIPVSCTSHHKH